ncbi:MAG: hypothetical protein AB8B60_12685 [Sulfitobacter sp.]
MRKWLFGFMCLCLAGPVLGEEGQVVMSAQGLTVRFDPPPWSTTRDLHRTSEIHQASGKTENDTSLTMFEVIPAGEDFDAWTQLYAMSAEGPLAGDFDAYVNGQVNVYARACDRAGVFHEAKRSASARSLIVLCDRYIDNPAQGEVGFFHMEMQGDTLVKVYHHIRVPAFDLGQVRAKPPVSIDKMRVAFLRVARTQIEPQPGG